MNIWTITSDLILWKNFEVVADTYKISVDEVAKIADKITETFENLKLSDSEIEDIFEEIDNKYKI